MDLTPEQGSQPKQSGSFLLLLGGAIQKIEIPPLPLVARTHCLSIGATTTSKYFHKKWIFLTVQEGDNVGKISLTSVILDGPSLLRGAIAKVKKSQQSFR